MVRRERELQLITKAAEVFDLPADILADLPHVELIGDLELVVSGHQGILSYSREQIDINGGRVLLRIKGTDLELMGMSEDILRIKGKLTAVEPMR